MGERRQLPEVGIRSNPILNRGAHQDNSMCGQVPPPPIGIVLSPEQKQQLMQVITQKLKSKKSNTAVRSNGSGS